jgi:hypothetical protein
VDGYNRYVYLRNVILKAGSDLKVRAIYGWLNKLFSASYTSIAHCLRGMSIKVSKVKTSPAFMSSSVVLSTV